VEGFGASAARYRHYLVNGTSAYIGLGSNLGDREQTIRAALDRLASTPGVHVDAVSALRQTDPVGPVTDQPPFLNGVARLKTSLGARELLALLLELELEAGRRRDAPPGGPRTLDLDLLLYGDSELDEPGLQVPHPRMHERRFVLEPLAELEPGLKLPKRGDVQALIARLD
jgi:2-amino-4-hydroxy-6-hydroxymethyldihydropteridine diphosphokinase